MARSGMAAIRRSRARRVRPHVHGHSDRDGRVTVLWFDRPTSGDGQPQPSGRMPPRLRKQVLTMTPTILFVHGAGDQKPKKELKKDLDDALFPGDPKPTTAIAYYSDICWPH